MSDKAMKKEVGKDFLKLLRNDPEELFRKHLIPDEDPVVDDEMVARIADWLNAYED